jgi:hypothetical protein
MPGVLKKIGKRAESLAERIREAEHSDAVSNLADLTF